MAEAPKKSSLLRAAVEALAQGNPPEAVRFCKQALKQDRQNYEAFVVLGKALFENKQYDQADMSYRRAVEINATGLRAWQGLAEVHEAAGNIEKIMEACEAIISICKSAGDTAHLAEYTRRLAAVHATIQDHIKAHEVWQSLLRIPSIPEALRLEALCGIIDANAGLMEAQIKEDCSRYLSQDQNLDSASARLTAEKDWASSNESLKMEEMLCSILEKLPQAEKYETLLLQVLICRMRASFSSTGQEWRQSRLRVLRLCLSVLSRHVSTVAISVLLSICEEDNADDLFHEIGMPQLAQGRADRIAILGKQLAHNYPDQGLVIATLAFAMHQSSNYSRNLGHKRSCCEYALRLNENSITGWQVLAEVRDAEGAYSSAAECVRRGLQVIARFRTLYGLSLQFVELHLRLVLGGSLLKSRAYSEASEVFQQIIKVAEGLQCSEASKLLTSALKGQVQVFLAEGRVQDASASLSSLLNIDADNSWALAEQGWLVFQNKDLPTAVNLLERAVALRPENASYHYRLGILYWTSRNILQSKEKSLIHLLESARLDSQQPEVFRILGHYYRETPAGGTNRAIRCYQKAVQLNCEDEEAGEALCDLLDSGGQELLEITICQEASQRSPRAFWSFRRLGYIQVSRKEWSDAVRNLQHAIRGYPTLGDVWEALGLAYQQLGMLTAALKAYGRVIAISDSHPIYALQQSGNILLTLGLYKKAVDMFQTALEKAPDHLAGHYGLASALLGQARECRFMGAIGWSAALLEEASVVMSRSAPKYANISSNWKLLGDIETTYARTLPWEISCGASEGKLISISRACETGRQLPEIFGTSLESWNKQRLLSAKRAKHAYQKALHLQPWKANLYADLCSSLELISSLDKDSNNSLSHELLSMESTACCGLALEGNNADIWTSFGALTRHKGLRQHAFVQALRVDGNHAVAWAQLGQLYLKEGEQELAKEAFTHARSADPTLALPWAAMSVIHVLNGSDGFQEAFASILYAAQLLPIAEFQLGLAKIAVDTHQLHLAQVHVAVEQAVLQAPDRPEVHNFKGLVCELQGNHLAATKAFNLARAAIDHSPQFNSSAVHDQRLAVSINLARALCKVGDAQSAVEEYETLAKSGNLEDGSALRGYAVALWQLGRRKLALSIAKVSVKKLKDPNSVSASIILLWKFIYSLSGPASALGEIDFVSIDFYSQTSLALTAFAIASTAVRSDVLLQLVAKHDVLFMPEKAAQFISLLAASMQLCQEMHGRVDYSYAIHLLQKAIHVYPQNVLFRSQLMQMLVQRSDGREVKVAARCCYANSLRNGNSTEMSHLYRSLGASASACSVCGSIKPQSSFSTCRPQSNAKYSIIKELQRWVHLEPWNLSSSYHLVLCLMQQAREQGFPVHACRMLQRMSGIVLTRLPKDDAVGKPHQYMRLQLLLCASESSLHCGDCDLATKDATEAALLQLPKHLESLAHLQLARCSVVRKNGSSLNLEYQKIKDSDIDDFATLLSAVELKFSCRLETPSSEVVLPEGMSTDQGTWKALLELKKAEMYIRTQDLSLAEKAASKAVMFWPEAGLQLLHGAICIQIFKSGAGPMYLSSAVRSLSKVFSGSVPMLPIAGLLLAQAEAGKSGSPVVKWEKYLRAEWSMWPLEHKPAELYFQMGLLVSMSKGTSPGELETPNSFQSARSWFRRAVHLNPSRVPYWTMLQKMEGDNK